jgi:hypothetical protein
MARVGLLLLATLLLAGGAVAMERGDCDANGCFT